MYVALVSCNMTRPDALVTVDLETRTVIHRLDMQHIGDELHHFGWNACSSCCDDTTKQRRYIILPGQRSSRIYIVDTVNPRVPTIHKVIEPSAVMAHGVSAPHTVHCLSNGQIMISMLGDSMMMKPGGFLLLNQNFDLVGRWSADESKMHFNHDFWYQPGANIMLSTEFAAPKDYVPGLSLSDVTSGKYGNGLCFWDWNEKRLLQRVNLGDDGLVTIGARFLHDPKKPHAFVASAMGSSLWHVWRDDAGTWHVQMVSQLEGYPVKGWPMPVPAFCSDIVISMDDHWLFTSNWFNGDMRMFDISNPEKPKMVSQLWCGAGHTLAGQQIRSAKPEFRNLPSGPHMLQLSLDGKRLYVTNSFLSTWDKQFYPDISNRGGQMYRINVDTEKGSMQLDEEFGVCDFGNVDGGTYRAHEMRYPGGDCTSDIWMPRDDDKEDKGKNI